MLKVSEKIVKFRKLILVLAFLLLIPSGMGYLNTKVNYDILYYLPDEIETMKGQDVLLDDFGKGAYGMFVCNGMNKSEVQNMKEEEKVAPKADEPRKDMGFISVSIGEGMNEIFRGLGVDYIIEGGQTMNPSTEDMLSAIDHVNADHIFILPNNKNIIMAANQAASLVEDKEIIVLPTKRLSTELN